MKKLNILTILFITTFFVACKNDDVKPNEDEAFIGNFEFQKTELIIDGNTLVLPFKFSSSELVFNSDGTFSIPEDMIFYEGKYAYSSKNKTITFSDDDPEYSYESVLDVEFNDNTYVLKSKIEDLNLDIFGQNELTYDQELALITLFLLDEYLEDPKVQEFAKKLDADPKKFSFKYYLKKKK